jgi:putative acetyltransferase
MTEPNAAPEIREEQPGDITAVHAIHTRAFPTEAEAKLVSRLREDSAVCASLVACSGETVIGHALFSQAHLRFETVTVAVGALGPIAVLPACQRTGIGDALIRSGLASCAALGLPAVIVLGDPAYYRRFGFQRADAWSIRCEFDVPTEAFRIVWLGASRAGPAVAKYHPAFSAVI